jgi:hypothetical protein
MTDEKTAPDIEPETTVIPYFFAFTFKAGGIVNSDMDEAALRSRLAHDLTEVYGEEGFEITEVRPATEEELIAVANYLRMDNEEQEVPTIQ